MKQIDEMVNRFLSWNLPDSVSSDQCVTVRDYGKVQGWPKRSGTSLLTADEARQMLEHVLRPDEVEKTATWCLLALVTLKLYKDAKGNDELIKRLRLQKREQLIGDPVIDGALSGLADLCQEAADALQQFQRREP